MRVLVTGAKGFVGRNLVEALKNIRDGKDHVHRLTIEEVYEVGRCTPEREIEEYCNSADFVFHLAGVNRPKDNSEFMIVNRDFTATLLEKLERCGNNCPVMLSSSVQASLAGDYGGSEYGTSKLAAEKLVFDHGNKTGARALVYRLPNLFGKWCRPDYNSVVATFCSHIANGKPIHINDRSTCLELLYIDDLIEELLMALSGKEKRCEYNGIDQLPSETGQFCYVAATHSESLGKIADMLEEFKRQQETLLLPVMPEDSLSKKLYATYLSYLPREKTSIALKVNADARGSFTELLKTKNCGQISVNISKPGITKGQHWHQTKCEIFIVVSGRGLVQQRRIGSDEVLSFEVSSDKLEAVYMLPGYTHSITNLSDSEELITLMWANELFDKSRPDTFGETV